MNTTIKYVAPWLAAVAMGGAVALAPIAGATSLPVPVASVSAVAADIDPLVPSGPSYHVSNHDEANTTNGFVDQPF